MNELLEHAKWAYRVILYCFAYVGLVTVASLFKVPYTVSSSMPNWWEWFTILWVWILLAKMTWDLLFLAARRLKRKIKKEG